MSNFGIDGYFGHFPNPDDSTRRTNKITNNVDKQTKRNGNIASGCDVMMSLRVANGVLCVSEWVCADSHLTTFVCLLFLQLSLQFDNNFAGDERWCHTLYLDSGHNKTYLL